MLHRVVLKGLLVAALFFFVSCGDDDESPTSTPSNHPPDAPVNNTGAGSPADNATGVTATPTLHWTCTDPDGDVLKYDIHFGDTDPPPALSTGQYAVSIGPISAENSTEYFWYVIAEDPSGERTQSATFSFTTVD